MTEEQVVWSGTVDEGAFACRVVRSDENPYDVGVMTVTHVASGEVIHTESVPLGYQAMFGPDVQDVAQWMSDGLVAIDHWIAQHQ